MSKWMHFNASDNNSSAKSILGEKRQRKVIIALVVIVVILGLWRILTFNNNNPASMPSPVVVTKVTVKDVPIYLEALGNVTPTYSVTVRTQINGLLMRVLYHEGQLVRAGELIAEIDDRPLQAQLVEYQGQYARDKAQLVNALIDLRRYKKLWQEDSISEQTLATQEALVKQLQGTIKLDEGLLQTTQVNLIYTKITSPIDGRIGLRLVDPGNFVQTGDTNGIAVINLLNPITVVFTLPEDAIPTVLDQVKTTPALVVQAFNRDQTVMLATGTLLAIDNQIDTSTGTVKLKASFQNEDNKLFPNQFVNVRLLIKTLTDATIVPTAAIQFNAKQSFVYVLNPDRTVKMKSVVTGVTMNEITTITSGLNPGEIVVIEGADKLMEGAKVKPITQTNEPISAGLQTA